jgi:hypothetical protein
VLEMMFAASVRASARMRADSACSRANPPPCASSSDERIASCRFERVEQRPPREAREQPSGSERDDGPDVEPGSLTRVHRSALLHQHDEQREHLGEDRDASSRKSGRLTAPVICAAAGWRPIASAAPAASLPMPSPRR